VLLPRQQVKLARGAKDKEHVMSQTPRTAVIGIGSFTTDIIFMRYLLCPLWVNRVIAIAGQN
jgi:hypothetical protein